MRRVLVIFAVVLFLPAAASAGTLFVIDGRGWGHGVGMSQYGARGYAEAGWGYERILAHYYRGTELRVVPARPVRVLLAERRDAIRIASTKPFRVVDARGKVRRLKPGGQRLAAGKLAKLRFPLRYEAGASPLTLDGEAYRGALIVHRDAGKLRSSTSSRSTATCAVSCRGRCPTTGTGGAARSVGRRTLVRTGDAEAGHALRPLRRHPQPGVRRHRRPSRHRRTARSARPPAGSLLWRAASRRPSTTRPRAGRPPRWRRSGRARPRCRTSSRCRTRTTTSRSITAGGRCG